MSEMVSGDSDVLPVSGIDGVVVMLFVLNTPSVNPGNSRYFIVLCQGALLSPGPGNYSHNKLSKDDNNCNFYPSLHCDVTVDKELVPLTSTVNLSELNIIAISSWIRLVVFRFSNQKTLLICFKFSISMFFEKFLLQHLLTCLLVDFGVNVNCGSLYTLTSKIIFSTLLEQPVLFSFQKGKNVK